MRLVALAFEEINKSHYLRRFIFNEKDSFVQVLNSKAEAIAWLERIFPQLFCFWQRWEARPSVGPEELVGRVGWLVWDIRVGFGFLFPSCLGVLVRGQVETNSKRGSERILLASGFHSRLTAVLARDRLHEAHSGPAAVCQLRSGRN